jgi:hypothetical protein
LERVLPQRVLFAIRSRLPYGQSTSSSAADTRHPAARRRELQAAIIQQQPVASDQGLMHWAAHPTYCSVPLHLPHCRQAATGVRRALCSFGPWARHRLTRARATASAELAPRPMHHTPSSLHGRMHAGDCPLVPWSTPWPYHSSTPWPLSQMHGQTCPRLKAAIGSDAHGSIRGGPRCLHLGPQRAAGAAARRRTAPGGALALPRRREPWGRRAAAA